MFYEKVFKALNSKKVGYALCGGLAMSLHGLARGTLDMDFVVALTKKNLGSIEQCLNELGLFSILPVGHKEIYNFKDEYIKNKNLIAWNFKNPKNPIESVDVLIIHDLSEFDCEEVKIGRTNCNIVSVESLIKMKKKAGRPQDLEDVKALRELLNE